MTITLENLAEATEQEVFDQVCNHLMSQGVASRDAEGKCLYRHGGLKCAAGCLISDEDYEDWMENLPWEGVLNANSNWSRKHEDLIDELQNIHDGLRPELWAEQLTSIAKVFDLKVPDCVKTGGVYE